MTSFRFQLNSDLFKIILAIIAAHGVTDFGCFWWVVVYPILWVLPDRLTTPIFFLLSVLHFADDIGVFGSMLFHSLILLAVAFKLQQLAFDVVVVFIGIVHVPLHYSRCCQKERYTALLIAAFSTCVSIVFSQTRKFNTFVFSELMQRVVCAHVVVESLLKIL